MQTILHKNDLSDGIDFANNIAADCEMMGLQPARDPLCLIQLYDGKGDCHLVQFIDQTFDAPNLKKLLSSNTKLKVIPNLILKNIICFCIFIILFYILNYNF